MSGWIKLDDGFIDHPKFLRAGPLAGYLHIAAMAWCNRNRTDGVVPRAQPARLVAWHTATDSLDPEVVGHIMPGEEPVSWAVLVSQLVDTGLWVERADGDYELHGYLEWQTSAEEILAKQNGVSAARSAAGKKGADARWNGKPHSKADSKPNGKPAANGKQTDSQEGRKKNEETALTALSDKPDDSVEEPNVGNIEDARAKLKSVNEQRVFDAWLEAAGKTGRTVFNTERRNVIRKALKDYPLDEVLDAVRGWRNSPHHRGENPTSTVYNDLEMLLRNSRQIEKFRDFQRNGNGQVPEPRGDGFGERLKARTLP
jgi:hypothetical protein